MKRWRRLSLEFYAAAFGYRVEFDLVPFQWALPQFGLSPGMAREQRLPSVKFGPVHIWTMLVDKWEVGLSADMRASLHTSKFSKVYPNSIVWPLYTVTAKESSE